MTVEQPPGSSPAQVTSERRAPKRSRGKRVAVLYNVDFEDAGPADDPAWAARAQVGEVSAGVAAILNDAGHGAHLIGVDGDLAALRARLMDLEAACAFNLCESLCGDARL